MWKSFLDSVVEAFAMCDPVAYMHYIECKRVTARQAALTPRYEGIHVYVDKWVAFSEQMGLWHDCEGAGATHTAARHPHDLLRSDRRTGSPRWLRAFRTVRVGTPFPSWRR